MNFNVDVEKLKKEIAFIDSNDLLYSLKRNADYLKHHNKNTTKAQDNAIDVLYAFINSLSSETRVRVIRTTEHDLLHGFHVGDIGDVIDYDPVDGTVLVKFDNGREWWFYPDQITEVE